MLLQNDVQENPTERSGFLSLLGLLLRVLTASIVVLGLILGLTIATVSGYWFFTTPYACVDETAYLRSLAERANSDMDLSQFISELESRSYEVWEITPARILEDPQTWLTGGAQMLEPRNSENPYSWYRGHRISTSAFVSTYDLWFATDDSAELVAFGYRSYSAGWRRD